MKPLNIIIKPAIFTSIAIGILLTITVPAFAYRGSEFEPIAPTEIYDREFIDDFFAALGYRPAGTTWVQESGTVRVLIDGALKAERGDVEAAMTSFEALPPEIAAAFPFFTTMREDLMVPDILDPWYEDDDARNNLFELYKSVWLPHPEYRDDFQKFMEDTEGRMSSRDLTEPAVWVRGHLSYYGFIEDRALQEDDPYLFLWDLLTGVSIYANRAIYYGLDWERYDEGRYQRAVGVKIAEMIRAAFDEAVRKEEARGFWFDVIAAHQPLETVSEGTQGTNEIFMPEITEPVSTPGPSEPESTQRVTTVEETDPASLFRINPEDRLTPEEQEIIGRAQDLEARVNAYDEALARETSEPVETPDVEEVAGPDIEPVTEPVETPDEVQAEPPTRTPSELATEEEPPAGISAYGTVRLQEIAEELALKIGTLANELGSETVDLVILYNDEAASDELLTNTEDRYIAKREAFLAGLAVWDRFHMEIYSSLSLVDFNDAVVNDIRVPYNEFKQDTQRWGLYWQFEAHFEEALGQIENGVRNRRDEADVLTAEQAALTRFLPEYNEMIKEIEDILAETGAVEPVETGGTGVE